LGAEHLQRLDASTRVNPGSKQQRALHQRTSCNPWFISVDWKLGIGQSIQDMQDYHNREKRDRLRNRRRSRPLQCQPPHLWLLTRTSASSTATICTLQDLIRLFLRNESTMNDKPETAIRQPEHENEFATKRLIYIIKTFTPQMIKLAQSGSREVVYLSRSFLLNFN
ncbi:hypothetical protein TSAR_002916, partial [Trichomalopsis sarcophagae]